MSTRSAADIMAARMAEFKQKQESRGALEGVQIVTPGAQKIDTQLIAVKPFKKSWEDLVATLDSMGALDADGLYRQLILKTVRDLYDQVYCAELETAAELAQTLARK